MEYWMKVPRYLCFTVVFCWLQCCGTLLSAQASGAQSAPAPPTPVPSSSAQASSGALRGQVSDPSGAAIANANVVLLPAAASSAPIKTQANGQGQYEFNSVAPGQYTLNVVAPGFSVYENDNVVISAGQPMRLNIAMAIEVEQQNIQVSDTAPTLNVNPENNAGAITLTGKELEALPDDPDELLTDLQALAGPSAGP